MILKRMGYDDTGRTVTYWTPNVESAVRLWDEAWQCYVIETHFKGGPIQGERVLLDGKEGVYLCNDEGKTIEVLCRPAQQ